jgi:hypothetical protein
MHISLCWHIAKMPLNIFKKPELARGVEEAPPLQVVQEGVAAGVEEPAQGALGFMGTAG